MGLLSTPAAPVSTTPGSAGLLKDTVPSKTPTSDPYFYAKNSDGSTIGRADDSDPYSGTPYFAYRTAGANATTTDKTRVASEFDPRKPAVTPYGKIRNERLPNSASQKIRQEEGATSNEQLDHRMALAIRGSNAPENLKLIPTSKNQAASGEEGQLQKDVAEGKRSLFDAQLEEAKNKGIKTPFTGPYEHMHHQNLLDYIKEAFHKLPSELAGIPNPF